MKRKVIHILIAIAFLFPNIIFAQPYNLGTAANFVLFSSTGALSNTGISFQTHLTGDVGKDGAGAITGFGNVNGVLQDNNAATNQAASDLLLAYTQLINAPSPIGHAPALGAETLNAGVYSILGAATLTGTINLDGQLNPNAVFIINIGGAFSTTAASQVNLINGAQACNVFWTTGDVVTLNVATVMKGTIIANNAAININPDVTLEGRALTTTGAISVNKISANIPSGCGRAPLTGPAAPDLFSTACYAIFSSSGDVTGDAATTVKGDIGSNFGSVAGYNQLKVNGTIHLIPDVSTGVCASDLIKVRDYLDLLTHDITLLRPTEFGNDLVLTPHTYYMDGAATFTGTLYLDAQNNPDGIFVIVTNGAFSTTTAATVSLLNGAKASNVFWRITGAAALEVASDIKGTIICTGGAISLKTGVNLDGRALTTAGAFSTAASTVTISSVCGALPVSWLYFRGKPRPLQKNVSLEWGTTNEMNNGFFTIEKSRDGRSFETVASVNATTGNGHAENDYSFTDQHPYSLTYYRISQTDRDGRKNYYHTIHIKMDIEQSLNASTYARDNYIYVKASNAVAGDASIELYSIEGRKISSQKIVLTNEASLYKINTPLHNGIFVVNIVSHGEKLYNTKVIVQ
ncbi:MAG TPA: ice-binding family protein [Chitinophagaceae bacterium]|nr:ice-binding family protein [Chitinophagaceae bacterium]